MPPDPVTILGAVGTIINVGALIFLVAAFYRGDIFAKPVVDKILALYEKRLDDLYKTLDSGVKEVNNRLKALSEEIRQRQSNPPPPPYGGKGRKKL